MPQQLTLRIESCSNDTHLGRERLVITQPHSKTAK